MSFRNILIVFGILLLIGVTSAAVDDAYTVFLLHNDNASLYDEGGHVITLNGNAAFDTTVAKFGNGSARFDGDGDFLSAPDSADWDMWQPSAINNITLDMWIYPTNLPTDGSSWSPIYSQANDANTFHQFGIVGNNTFKWWFKTGGTLYEVYNKSLATALVNNTWYHVAAVRDNTRYVVYVNGYSLGANTSADTFPYSTGVFNVGKSTGLGTTNYFAGFIDEFRLSKGIARWSSNFTPPTYDYRQREWEYTTPGTFYWVCPDGITRIRGELAGGGGSGASAASLQRGLGGSASVPTSFTYDVTPGVNYTITVGKGGDETAPSSVTPSNNGDASNAFGHTGAGGIGGAREGIVNGNGTAGANGELGGTGDATAGGNTSFGEYGGSAGTGDGAGGGGGATHYGGSSGDPAYFGKGGAGADGIVRITSYDSYSGNIPNFAADRTTGGAGTLVHFTDTSTITDASDMTYLWNFGDGSNSTTVGSVSHVFAYIGSYDISLTITTTSGSVVETKEAYINLVNDQTELDIKTEPNPVQFTLVDRYGHVLKNIAVTAKMTSSSSDGTNWFTTILGIPGDATSVNETTMHDVTDDGGAVVFPMVGSAMYHLTFTNATQGVSDAKDVHPSLSSYIYILSSTATAVATNMADYVTMELSTYPPKETNPATVYLIGNYSDTSSTTSSVLFFVNCTNGTPIYSNTTAASTANRQYAVTNTIGHGYVWGFEATSTQFGALSKAMGITLSGTGEHGLASNLLKVCNNWECT